MKQQCQPISTVGALSALRPASRPTVATGPVMFYAPVCHMEVDPATAPDSVYKCKTGGGIVPTRREMIESVLAFSIWPRLRPIAATPLPQTANAAAPDDEAFWAHVRSQFELVPEVTNLVSVIRGKFTKANREISFNEAARLNQGAAPLPDSDQPREIRKKAAGNQKEGRRIHWSADRTHSSSSQHNRRFLFIANTAPFTSIADVDRLADAIEATAKAS